MNATRKNLLIFCIFTLLIGWVGVELDYLMQGKPEEKETFGMAIWLVFLSGEMIYTVLPVDRITFTLDRSSQYAGVDRIICGNFLHHRANMECGGPPRCRGRTGESIGD